MIYVDENVRLLSLRFLCSVSNMIIPAAVSIIEVDELFRRMEKAEAEYKVLKEVADREADERESLERQAIVKAEAEGQAPRPPALERGALVRINVGPFTNHRATVLDIDNDDETVSPLRYSTALLICITCSLLCTTARVSFSYYC